MTSQSRQMTGPEKDKIKAGAIYKTVEELQEAADWFFGNGLPQHGEYVRYLIAQRKANGYAYRPDAPQEPRTRQSRDNTPAAETKPLITAEQGRALVLSVGILGGGATLVAYVVIPAAIAVGQFLVMAAPYIGAGLVGVMFLVGLRSEKKTEVQSQAPQARRIVVTQTTEIYE